MPQVLASPPRATGRLAAGLVLGGGLLAVVALAGLAVGSRPLPLGEVWAALTGRGTGDAALIVLDQRLPRTLLGLGVGAALAVAGVLAQGLTRNPHR